MKNEYSSVGCGCLGVLFVGFLLISPFFTPRIFNNHEQTVHVVSKNIVPQRSAPQFIVVTPDNVYTIPNRSDWARFQPETDYKVIVSHDAFGTYYIERILPNQ